MQDPVLKLWDAMKEELGIKREDFTELKKIVLDLAKAPKETDRSIKHLSDTIDLRTEDLEGDGELILKNHLEMASRKSLQVPGIAYRILLHLIPKE